MSPTQDVWLLTFSLPGIETARDQHPLFLLITWKMAITLPNGFLKPFSLCTLLHRVRFDMLRETFMLVFKDQSLKNYTKWTALRIWTKFLYTIRHLNNFENIFKNTYLFGLDENSLDWDYFQDLRVTSILVWDAIADRVPQPQPHHLLLQVLWKVTICIIKYFSWDHRIWSYASKNNVSYQIHNRDSQIKNGTFITCTLQKFTEYLQ